MSEEQLKYLSTSILKQLKTGILDNIEQYRGDGFGEVANQKGWQIPLDIKADLSPLEDLKGESGSENEVNNSLIVWKALYSLTPALATENRFWTRISHQEGFFYSQARWLDLTKDNKAVAKQVETHFFASSLTRYRDDHAISRLWWNAYVAKQLRPENQHEALELILKSADIRKSIIERSLSFSRIKISRALLRAMHRMPEVTSERNFREFMVQVNKFGGGIVFETLPDAACDNFMDTCWGYAEPLVESKTAH